MKRASFRTLVAATLAWLHVMSQAAPDQRVLSLAEREKAPMLKTLEQVVGIESGSRDVEGLARAAELIAARLTELGGRVEQIPAGQDIYRMADTPEKLGASVRVTFSGTGTRSILLLAHMDTVYPRGTIARQPFRIDGDRVYGVGIADDKHGVALILHVASLLKQLEFRS